MADNKSSGTVQQYIRCSDALNGKSHEPHEWFSITDPEKKRPFQCNGDPAKGGSKALVKASDVDTSKPGTSVSTTTGTKVPVTVKTSTTGSARGNLVVRKNPSHKMTVREARKIAFFLHEGDKDKIGHPYGEHLEAVRKGVEVLGGGEEEQIAALFHDAVEDYHCTYKHLEGWNLTEHTIDMIEAVTKTSNEEQGKYLARIIECGAGAMRVKLADLLHNTRHDRMAEVAKIKGDYTRDRLLKKYRPAMARLMLELGMIVDEDEQKKLATKPVGTSSTYNGYGTSSASNADGSQMFEVTSLIIGDWPKTWPAPIVCTMEQTKSKKFFLLANGEIRGEELYWVPTPTPTSPKKKVATWTITSWDHEKSTLTTSAIRAEFAHMVDIAKKENAGSLVTTAYVPEGADEGGFDWSKADKDDEDAETLADLIDTAVGTGYPKETSTEEPLWGMSDEEFATWADQQAKDQI